MTQNKVGKDVSTPICQYWKSSKDLIWLVAGAPDSVRDRYFDVLGLPTAEGKVDGRFGYPQLLGLMFEKQSVPKNVLTSILVE